MPVVKMPDGTLVDMPDNPTPEQRQALLGKLAGAMEPGAGVFGPENPVLRGAKVAGGGLVQGILGPMAGAVERLNSNPISSLIPGPNGILAEKTAELLGYKPKPGFEPGVAEEAVRKLDVPPETGVEGYIHSGAAGIGGAALIPMGGPASVAMQGLASGLGSETAAKTMGDNPFIRLLGGLAGGAATGVVRSALPQRANVAREIMRDVAPQDFQQAVAGMERNAAQGVPTNLSQTMPNASNIDSAVGLMANNRYGVNTTAQLRRQPGQAELEMEALLSKLPGAIHSEQAVANAGQDAMTETLRLAKKSRTDRVNPFYDSVGELPPQAIKNVRDLLAEKVMEPGTDISTIKTIQALGRELQESSATGLPRTHAKDVKAAIDHTIRAGIKDTQNPASPKAQGELKHLTAELYKTLGNSSPTLKEANALFKKISETEIDPLKKSVVGRIAGTGARADKEASLTKIYNLFDRGTSPGAQTSDILDFEKAARAIDPTVYPNAVKSWMASKMDDAFASETARGPQDVSRELTKAFGDPMRGGKAWKSTEDIVAGLERSAGVPAGEYVNGMKSLMRLNSELAIRPSSVSGVTQGELVSMSKDSALTRAGSTSFIAPLRQPALYTARLIGASVLKDVDKWLTTPEGAATLAKLGKQEYMSPGWINTLQTMAGTQGAQDASE